MHKYVVHVFCFILINKSFLSLKKFTQVNIFTKFNFFFSIY